MAPKKSFRRFVGELKRRHVIRVGVAYIVVAFALLQGADLVLPALLMPSWTFRLLVLVVLFLFPIVLVLAWVYDLTPEGVRRTEYEVEDDPGATRRPEDVPRVRRPEAPPAARVVGAGDSIDSVAILPFSNAGDDADSEYLSDGITESIINKMATINGIRVVPRASAFRFKGRDLDPAEVARELEARALVMGRVHQRGDMLVVQAELIDMASEAQLWGEHYKRPMADIFIVQEEMAEEIARSLRLQLTGKQRERLRHRDTHDTEAYQAYLKGRFYWNKRTGDGFKLALTHFQEAVDLDPNYALVYSGIADTYNVLGYYNIQAPRDTYPRAKAAAARALEIDAGLAEAHASLGYALLFYDRAYEEAARELRRSIELNPSYATAHQWYGWYLLVNGRFDETVESLSRAVEMDPLSLIINDHYGYALFLAGRYGDARAQLEKTIELDPRYPLGYWRLGNLLFHQGQTAEAIEAFEKAAENSGGILARGYLGQALAVAGRSGEARGILAELSNDERVTYASPLDRALIHSGLGEMDETFAALQDALEHRSSDLVRLKLLPWPPEVRRDARFQDVLHEVNPAEQTLES